MLKSVKATLREAIEGQGKRGVIAVANAPNDALGTLGVPNASWGTCSAGSSTVS